ncbi:MAG TPA: acyl-CoA dehydrogenase family protein, partial [Acidimicrobiales bacterium]|nr:acyl-CoA dehydrogenase family protein [Acidimicrobiales bacterium]
MPSTPVSVGEEASRWVKENWDNQLTVGAWWQRLADAGYSNPMLPPPYGRGVTQDVAGLIIGELARGGALGPPGGLGLMLAAPTIATHGTDKQQERFIPDIITGRAGWCQLFSEPGAGSDLAGLRTTAVRDGDEWVINGQKVWTSTGQHADWGILLARTDPDAPKHKGISYFLFPMHQDGVEVRPLREMTGRSLFNEVFLTDARVPDSCLLGGLNNGWAVANTTLMF